MSWNRLKKINVSRDHEGNAEEGYFRRSDNAPSLRNAANIEDCLLSFDAPLVCVISDLLKYEMLTC